MSRGIAIGLALLAALTPLTGCLESTITVSCTEMGEAKCSSCFSCAQDEPGLSPQDLCQLTEGTSQQACVDQFVTVCEDQASARQLTRDELDACKDVLEQNLSCEQLYEGAAQGHALEAQSCEFLF